MSSSVGPARLRKEFIQLKKKPVENIRAAPRESDIFEWRYVIEGPKGSPYEGGFYHGTLLFPKEFPFKPPSIQMHTPNGRFKTNTRLCLSMSDFHPETWDPLWSVGAILVGLYTFMLSDQATYGSIETTTNAKRIYAAESLEFNVANKVFCELFPDLVELHEERKKAIPPQNDDESTSPTVPSNANVATKASASWTTIIGILVAIVALTWGLLSVSI